MPDYSNLSGATQKRILRLFQVLKFSKGAFLLKKSTNLGSNIFEDGNLPVYLIA